MDEIFDALADGNRRNLLDALYEKDGSRLSDLCALLDMTRQAASKHLAVLERAGLVAVAWKGREKLHYLNPVPLRDVYHRWISKFDETRIDALRDLKADLERDQGKEEMAGEVPEAEAPKRLSYSWKSPGSGGQESKVLFEL